MKVRLISISDALLYTPENEHFGIVPLESMYLGTPVFARDSGGPKETVKSGETGELLNTEIEWKDKMKELLENKSKYDREKCKEHILQVFIISVV